MLDVAALACILSKSLALFPIEVTNCCELKQNETIAITSDFFKASNDTGGY